MFGFGSKVAPGTMVAPATGTVIPMSAVPDPVFSQKMMGDGYAVLPTSGDIYSPVGGTITTVFPTKHAIGITTEEGIEVLVHMGIDTVSLNGAPFDVYVKSGEKVKAGSKIANADLDAIKAAGKERTIVVVITNSKSVVDFAPVNQASVRHGDTVLSVSKK